MALSALLVLALVGVVAVAATGSVPRRTSASRPRPDAALDTFFDTLFTLGLLAVIVGGALFVYGLAQRKAIARELASGRYGRMSLPAFLASAVAFAAIFYFRARNWTAPDQPVDEPVFGGEPLAPTRSDGSVVNYEPSVSWVVVLTVAALVVAAIAAYVLADRRARAGRAPDDELAEQLALALDDALDDLRGERDPRRAVIAAYARMERVLAANGAARRPSETADEYLARVLGDLELTPDAIGRLTALFTQAKFSHHAVDSAMKESAIAALEEVRDELRSLRERPHAVEGDIEAVTS